MTHRRTLLRTPLLVGGGLAAFAAQAGSPASPKLAPVGNLMPPPIKTEICVERTPASATLTAGSVTTADPCIPIEGRYGQTVTVDVAAPGYTTAHLSVDLSEKIRPQTVLLAAETSTPVPAEPVAPVGNLMAPPKP